MGTCSSGNSEEVNEQNDLILTPNDIQILKNSWSLVVKDGLSKYGTNMMIKYENL